MILATLASHSPILSSQPRKAGAGGGGAAGEAPTIQHPSPAIAVTTPLPQEFWRRPDGQPATREHLLMALADLDELLVRATFSSMPLAASISAVSLEVAQPGPSEGPRAPEVEECRCPPGYVGSSCQVSVASPGVCANTAGSASSCLGVPS